MPIKPKSKARQELENRMRRCRRGDELTLSEMEQITGVNFTGRVHSRTDGYVVAQAAAKFIESETAGEICFRWCPDRGVWRALLEKEIPSETGLRLRHIGRQAKRNVCIGTGVSNYEEMSEQERQQLTVNITLSSAISTFANRRTQNRIMKMLPGVSAMTEEAAVAALQARKQVE